MENESTSKRFKITVLDWEGNYFTNGLFVFGIMPLPRKSILLVENKVTGASYQRWASSHADAKAQANVIWQEFLSGFLEEAD